MGYYLDYYWTEVADNHPTIPYSINTVTNQDYFIAHKGFFWDLGIGFCSLNQSQPYNKKQY